MKIFLAMPLSSLLLDVLDTYGHEGIHAHPIGQDRASDGELLEITHLSCLKAHATIGDSKQYYAKKG